MRTSFRPTLLALCALALTLLIAACGGSAKTAARSVSTPGATTNPHTTTVDPAASAQVTGSGRRGQLVSILQDDPLTYGDAGPTFATLKALGVDVVRFNVIWNDFAPDPMAHSAPAGFAAANPAAKGYNFGLLDNLDRVAAGAKMGLDLTLMGGAPAWAQGAGKPSGIGNGQWKINTAEWAQFVTAVGTRYSGHYTPPGASSPLPRVNFWSLWNEPNYGPDIAPQSEQVTINGTKTIVDLAAGKYRQILNAGWDALRASGHTTRTDTILIGETAPAGELDPGIDNMTPGQQFVRDLYCVSADYRPLTGTLAADESCPGGGSGASFRAANPALFQASGWSDHPYAYTVPPSEKVPGTGAEANDFTDFGRIPELTQTLDESASAWGQDPRLLIYNTEYGYFSKPPATLEAQPLATVAAWINQAEYLSWKNPRIASYDQYLLEDPTTASGSAFDTGLEFSNGTQKPEIFDAYRLPLWLPNTTASGPATLAVWGCARPLDQTAFLSHTVDIQFASPGGAFKTLKQVTLDPATNGCYFDTGVHFASSGSVRLQYREETMTEVSRTQAITIR